MFSVVSFPVVCPWITEIYNKVKTLKNSQSFTLRHKKRKQSYESGLGMMVNSHDLVILFLHTFSYHFEFL
jgi:hypothetical protein